MNKANFTIFQAIPNKIYILLNWKLGAFIRTWKLGKFAPLRGNTASFACRCVIPTILAYWLLSIRDLTTPSVTCGTKSGHGYAMQQIKFTRERLPIAPSLFSLLELLFPFLLVLDTTAKVWTGGHVDIIESEVYRGGKEIYLCPQKKQRGDLEYFNFHVSVVYLSSAPCLSFPFFLEGPNILLDIQLQETSMGSYFTPHFHIFQVLKRHIS